jgi:hypothetical protein
MWGANECEERGGGENRSKKSVARSDSVWRGPKGRSQLPLEINRRSGQSYSTRIGLEEQRRASSSSRWEQLIDAKYEYRYI